jgi:hypothetical protein
MSKQVRFRRGTTAQHSTFTGAEAELTVDTTKNQVVVHDGATAGGVPLLREDRPRGYTKLEFITATNTTWTQSGKTDLKRIRVTAYGGGGGGAASGGGGGSGGIGFCTLEANVITTNVTVTVGAGGAPGASGGSSSFGSYITATGGSPGSGRSGGAGGTASGTPAQVYVLGGAGGNGAHQSASSANFPAQGHVNGGTYGTSEPANGGGIGGGRAGSAGNGVFGGGGGRDAGGAQGCVIIEEIYGFV